MRRPSAKSRTIAMAMSLPLAASTKNLGDSVEITNSRQRPWHSARREGEDVQSVLHNKTRWRGHWPWPIHHSRHHREATFGVYRGRHPAWRVHRGPNCSAARGGVHHRIPRTGVILRSVERFPLGATISSTCGRVPFPAGPERIALNP